MNRIAAAFVFGVLFVAGMFLLGDKLMVQQERAVRAHFQEVRELQSEQLQRLHRGPEPNVGAK